MPLDLNNTKILEAVKWYTNQAVSFDLLQRARQIILSLPKMLAEIPVERPDLQMEYQNILARAKFIALPTLDGGDIVELLQSRFVQIFELPDYDLWEKLKTKLISISQFEGRDGLKKKIREALLLNNQTLTKEGLVLDANGVKGTVKNWLTDYHRSVGTGEVETLKMSQYLIGGDNTKKLSDESRRKLDCLFKFYEKLKISSTKIQGIEEQVIFNVDSELDVVEEGIIERIGHEIKEIVKRLEGLKAAEELRGELGARYWGDEEEIKKAEEEKKKLLKITGNDFGKLADLLFKVVNSASGRASNKIQTEAILKILAEQGNLENLLEEKRFNEMMVAHLEEGDGATDLEGFKVNPRAPQYVSAFLQHILKDKVGVSEDESGRIGMQIFNLMAKGGEEKKYQGLVYFDLEKKEFRWS